MIPRPVQAEGGHTPHLGRWSAETASWVFMEKERTPRKSAGFFFGPSTGGVAAMEVELTILNHCALETRIALHKLPAIVGRDPQAEVPLDDPWMSRAHCVLDQCDGYLVVRDLGSRNGVFLNGRRVRQSAVLPGERFTVGLTKITVQYVPATTPAHGAAVRSATEVLL
jgi:hypothetical protein